MNLYLLVEGRRTEMAIYPAWIELMLPQMRRIFRPFDVKENNYYIVSGFGFPNLLGHIKNCAKDIDRYPEFDYLLICLDSDDESISSRIREVEQALNSPDSWPEQSRVKVVVQRKCIESWLLGAPLMEKAKSKPAAQPFLSFYDVTRNDPEKMGKPNDYHGSASGFHCTYLTMLCESIGTFYSKRNPQVACTQEYVDGLYHRVHQTQHLSSLRNLFDFLDYLATDPPPPIPRAPRPMKEDTPPRIQEETNSFGAVGRHAEDLKVITKEPLL